MASEALVETLIQEDSIPPGQPSPESVEPPSQPDYREYGEEMAKAMAEFPYTKDLLDELKSVPVQPLPEVSPETYTSGKGTATIIDDEMRDAAISAFALHQGIEPSTVSLDMVTLSFLTDQLYLHVWSSVFLRVVGLSACTCLW